MLLSVPEGGPMKQLRSALCTGSGRLRQTGQDRTALIVYLDIRLDRRHPRERARRDGWQIVAAKSLHTPR